MNRLVAQNPALRPVVEQLEKLQAARHAHQSGPTVEVTTLPHDDTSDDAGRPRAPAPESDMSAMIELRAQAESMFIELQRLRDLSCDLAAALGACPMCWGGDTDCRSCHGRGGPGFSVPEPELFVKYVVPAARMWRLQRLGIQRTRALGGDQADVADRQRASSETNRR
jgi:hypothetical protein